MQGIRLGWFLWNGISKENEHEIWHMEPKGSLEDKFAINSYGN
jgi:hypothetical protein